MPTKRRRRARHRVETATPAWAAELLSGNRPEPGTEAADAFFGWLYFGDTVPGLPDADSPEGRRLWCDYVDQA